ncbi:MAG: hypothetical protein IIZ18_06500, partial [Ruminococcus sp.]|nr:hypothetical protein [Ruminococcus sp.]
MKGTDRKATGQQDFRKTTGFRRKPCAGIISGDRLVRSCPTLGYPEYLPVKIGKGVEKGGFRKGESRGENLRGK